MYLTLVDFIFFLWAAREWMKKIFAITVYSHHILNQIADILIWFNLINMMVYQGDLEIVAL